MIKLIILITVASATMLACGISNKVAETGNTTIIKGDITGKCVEAVYMGSHSGYVVIGPVACPK